VGEEGVGPRGEGDEKMVWMPLLRGGWIICSEGSGGRVRREDHLQRILGGAKEEGRIWRGLVKQQEEGRAMRRNLGAYGTRAGKET
jgi:hypothetical protein